MNAIKEFEENGLVVLVDLIFLVDAVSERIGIHPSAGALVDAVLEEHRVGVRRRCWIGGDGDGFFPNSG